MHWKGADHSENLADAVQPWIICPPAPKGNPGCAKVQVYDLSLRAQQSPVVHGRPASWRRGFARSG